METVKLKAVHVHELAKKEKTIPVLFPVLSILFMTNTPIYLIHRSMLSLSPSNILGGGVAVLLFSGIFWGRLKGGTLQQWISSYLQYFWPYLGIGVMYLTYYLAGYYYQSENPGQDSFLALFQAISSVIILYYLICFNVDPVVVIRIFEISLLVLIITVYIDMAYPQTFSELDTRPAGLPENPNTTAFRLDTLLAFLLISRIAVYKKAFYLVTGCIATFLTFSRGGLLLLALLLFYILALNLSKIKLAAIVKALLNGTFYILSLIILANLINFDAIDKIVRTDYTASRFNMFSSVNTFIDKNDSRVDLAGMYFDKAADKVWTGNGALEVQRHNLSDQGPHNMYIFLLYEIGIAGFLLYVVYIVLMLKKGIQWRSNFLIIWAGSLLIYSIFTHTLIFEYFFLFTGPLIHYLSLYEKEVTGKKAKPLQPVEL